MGWGAITIPEMFCFRILLNGINMVLLIIFAIKPVPPKKKFLVVPTIIIDIRYRYNNERYAKRY